MSFLYEFHTVEPAVESIKILKNRMLIFGLKRYLIHLSRKKIKKQ